MAFYVPTISYPESSGSSDRWLKSMRTLGTRFTSLLAVLGWQGIVVKCKAAIFFRKVDSAFLIPRQKPKIISLYYLYKKEKLSLLSRNIIKEGIF